MFHVFNMGLGMLVIVSREQVSLALDTLPNNLNQVGEIITGDGQVLLENL